MASQPISIDAVMLGRNDEYEPRWNEKLFASIAYNRARFEGSSVDYRVTFVEWNPPAERPLLAPLLTEQFPFLRAIVVEPAVHAALCTGSLQIMLNFSLNCGLRTSTADYCLISAGDLFISRQLASYVKELGLVRNCLYRAERVNIRADLDFGHARPEDIEDPVNVESVNSCTTAPYDVPPYTHACGDFLLMDRISMQGIRGFDEGIRFARLHLDSRFCHTAIAAGLHCNLAGRIFHISHTKSFTNQLSAYADQPYSYMKGLPYVNSRAWGLADHSWRQVSNRCWSVAPPDGTENIPFSITDEERNRTNSVTRRIVNVKNSMPPIEPTSDATLVRFIPVTAFKAASQWHGASVTGKRPTRIETVAAQWGYSAALPLMKVMANVGKSSDFHFIAIDAQVERGAVGVGLLKGGNLDAEAEVKLDSSQGRRVLYLPVSGNEDEVIVRNVVAGNINSSVVIHDCRLIRQPPVLIGEKDILL